MLRCGKQLRHRRELDHAAEIHHGDIIGHLRDHAHVMGDQHQRHAFCPLQPAQQRQDLRLRRDVERGGRLVRDQDLRIGGQRQRNADALAQAAAELERIGVDPRFRARNADLVQQRHDALARLRLRDIAVRAHRLDDLVADGVVHAERGHRLLEDQPDPAAAHRAHGLAFGVERRQILLFRRTWIEQHTARGDPVQAGRSAAGSRARSRSCRSRFRRPRRAPCPREGRG